ncbi:aminotransferase class V-fold PLP-dependent enzyme [Cereibacter sediminicola]|uniref:aminotransferase class V-fold PLP-dependent enzyme n=1 Tax=Cereibacter sediminicola TaxID=2584941 RepID=UPI0011A02B16|nr:aminotransferase class V-fold PLP-dependent enzyme [Cereibacter sediminicola]
MTVLDIDYVRACFPALSEPALAGQAFFENAGGSYTCRQVIDRLSRFYHQRKVQPYAPYAASHAAGAEMDEARSRLAALMGVEEDELSFGPSTSANTFVLAQAVRGWLKREGGAVVVTDQDHEANSGVWRRLADDGIEVREWRIDPDTGHLDPAGLAQLLGDGRVRLVCFPHCSNVVGEINPVAEICAMARAAGAFTCVDGVSYAPHGLPDMGTLGADIYLFSAYKTYGPHQGLMLIRREVGELLPAQGHWFNAGTLYKRFTPAGPDHAQVAACAGLADYIDALADHHMAGSHRGGPEAGGALPLERGHEGPRAAGLRASPVERAREVHRLMREHEIRLLRPLLDQLARRNDVRLLGPSEAGLRAPTVALALDRPAEQVATALAAHGIMASGGDFYAARPLEAMGVDRALGVLRVSFVHYTSEAEVAQLMLALDAVL